MGKENENKTRTPSLWELTREEEEIIAAVIDADGELTEDRRERLDALRLAKADKVDSYRHVDMTLCGNIDMLKKEEERLRRRRQTFENARRGLRDYLLWYMDSHGITKLEGPYTTISVQDNAEKVECDEDALVNEYYQLVWAKAIKEMPKFLVMSLNVDKTVLKEMIRNGEPVPEGVSLVRGRSVRIR